MKRYLLCFATFWTAACGGGGGGGDAAQDRGLRLLHGALAAAPVAALLDGSIEPTTATRFGDSGVRLDMSEGTHQVQLQAAGGSPALFSRSIEYRRETYPMLLLWQREPASVELKAIESAVSATTRANTALVRLVPAVLGAAGAAANVSGVVIRAENGTTSDYREIDAGNQTVRITEARSNSPLTSIPLTLEPEKRYTLFVTGERGYFVTARSLED